MEAGGDITTPLATGGGKNVSFSGTNVTITNEAQQTQKTQDGNANVQLSATNNITVEDIEDDLLQFMGGSGKIEFSADRDNDGAGIVRMDGEKDTIKTNGRDLTITGAQLDLKNINTSSQDGNGGDIKLNAGGDITTKYLSSWSGAGNGGDIELNAGGDITTPLATGGGENVSFSGINITITNKDKQEDKNPDGDADVKWLAKNDITFKNIEGDVLEFMAGSGKIEFTADMDNDGAGIVRMDGEKDTIKTNGRDLTIIGAKLDLGNINTSSSDGNGGDINLKAGGDITTQYLDSSSDSSSGNSRNGGDINLEAGGNIKTRYLDSGSYSRSDNLGNGGDIKLNADGDITTEYLYSGSYSSSGNSGDGGDIELNAGGDIETQDLYSLSYSISGNSGNAISGNSGNGGDIKLNAGGNIETQYLNSGSHSRSGNSGNGGAIDLDAKQINPLQHGNAEKLKINTFSVGSTNSEKGGEVNIITNNLSNTDILTLSSHSESGKVTIESKTQEPLQIKDSSITTSEQATVTIEIPWDEIKQVEVETGDTQSGQVFINSPGDLNLNNVTIKSDTKSNQNAGNVNIDSSGQIFLNSTQIISTTNAKGNAGNIIIKAPQNIELTNNSKLQADTQGSGKAGTITIEADTIDIGQDAKISATILQSTNKEGGGSIEIDTNTLNISGTLGIFAETEGLADAGSLTLKPYKEASQLDINFSNNGFISASTKSTGNGGNISITAPENINITGQGEIRVTTNNIGNAGTIKIETQNLKTSDQVSITASTTGDGNAGAINIDTNTFDLTTGTSLTTETESVGKAGDIRINSEIVTIGKGAKISATAKEGASNTEAGGGNININANQLNISGQLGIFAQTEGEAPAGKLTLKTYNDTPDLDINFSNQGFISASTKSKGSGGNIEISAPLSIDITGDGKISVETSGAGGAGNIEIKTQNLKTTDGIDVTASTTGAGDAGNINIETDKFNLEAGTSLTTETNSSGNAGDITINTQTLTIGEDAKISATAKPNATETAVGGNITINSNQLYISGELGIFAETQGEAAAGKLTLKTYNNNPDLDINFNSKNGSISARTISTGQGGNIEISAPETIDITGNGEISVKTTGAGNAGNISIETPNLT
ncbi:hypothetical protein VV11_011425, partial [Trichodesmium erythraeum 21-75]|nr:hypothetical protein [Trichodesmium erythraeum 21-75]